MATTETTNTTAATGCCPSPADGAIERLARLAKALADPIRLRMLDVMAQGRGCCGLIDPAERGVPGGSDPEGICVCEFQERFGLAQSKTSYHLRVLKEAGLVREETRGKWTFYSVDDRAAAAALGQLSALLRA
jgi:ArsR family transcriptional regulator